MRLASPKEVSDITGIRQGLLSSWRWRGLGPPYMKFGAGKSKILYDLDELADWLEGQKDLKGLVTPQQIEQKLGLAAHMLAHWRVRGEGPPYIRCRGKHPILYDLDEVIDWIAKHRVQPTRNARPYPTGSAAHLRRGAQPVQDEGETTSTAEEETP